MTAVWSIGKKIPNVDAEFKTSPGPCAYSPEVKNKYPTPAWSMHGIKSRAIYAENDAPGPGTYKLLNKVLTNHINIECWTQNPHKGKAKKSNILL